MKIISQICLVTLLFIACSMMARVNAVYYLQMIPYLDDNCTESHGSAGVGFSFMVGQCMGVGDLTVGAKNIYVTLNGDESIATISTYKNYDPTCQDIIPNANSTWVVGECYRAPAYANIGWKITNNFVRIKVVENPSYVPLYGFRQTIYADSQCSSNPQWYYYYTNGTVFNEGNDYSQTFYCDGGSPNVVTCQNGCSTSYAGIPCARDVWNLHEHNYYLNSC